MDLTVPTLDDRMAHIYDLIDEIRAEVDRLRRIILELDRKHSDAVDAYVREVVHDGD